MKLIEYKRVFNKYYKNDKLISKQKALEELSKAKQKELLEKGTCKTRNKVSIDKSTTTPKTLLKSSEIKRSKVLKSKNRTAKTEKTKTSKKSAKKTTQKIAVKEKNTDVKEEKPIITMIQKEHKLTAKEKRILNKIRNDYKVFTRHYVYQNEVRLELERKNKQKGFYNFVCYLDDMLPETIDTAILQDYKNQQAQKIAVQNNIDEE